MKKTNPWSKKKAAMKEEYKTNNNIEALAKKFRVSVTTANLWLLEKSNTPNTLSAEVLKRHEQLSNAKKASKKSSKRTKLDDYSEALDGRLRNLENNVFNLHQKIEAALKIEPDMTWKKKSFWQKLFG